MNEDSLTQPPSPKASSTGWVLLLLLLLGVVGVMAHRLAEIQRAQAAADAAVADTEAALAEAQAALAMQAQKERRKRLADAVFPLPARNPFGGPRPGGDDAAAMAQIPPPPPRMHEIPSSLELKATGGHVPGAMTAEGVMALRLPEAAKELESAKLKEADQDVIAALKHLDFANKLEPNHPEILYRFGILFEKLGNKKRAAEHFQAVAAMEDRAGKFAALATHYLNGENPEALPGGLLHRPLSIGPAFADLSADEDGNRTVKLALSIRAASGVEIDPHAVVPYIYFYDLVDDLEIMPCDGEQPPVEEVNPWRSENPDYVDPEEELLDVTYHIPHFDDGATRKFFGYVVKLYYRDEIQDVLVEPRVLVELLSEEGGSDSELDATLFDN